MFIKTKKKRKYRTINKIQFSYSNMYTYECELQNTKKIMSKNK